MFDAIPVPAESQALWFVLQFLKTTKCYLEVGNQLRNGTRLHPTPLKEYVPSLPWSCTCKLDVWWSPQSDASCICLGQRFLDPVVHYRHPCWETGPCPAVGSTPGPTTSPTGGLCRWKTSCWVYQRPNVPRMFSKSQRLLVVGYLLVVISWLFTVLPYMSPAFVINYSCSYCRGPRSADAKVEALFLRATPCSTVTSLQRPVGEHNLEGSVKVWTNKTGKRRI